MRFHWSDDLTDEPWRFSGKQTDTAGTLRLTPADSASTNSPTLLLHFTFISQTETSHASSVEHNQQPRQQHAINNNSQMASRTQKTSTPFTVVSAHNVIVTK